MADTDQELLALFTRQNDQDAFTELVRRHLGLVFFAALRQVRSQQLAEEVAQSTFLDLARQARQLAPDTILASWLYRVTRRTAVDVIRRETRRERREQTASELNAMNASSPDWTHIEPLLDDAMHTLDDVDRTAVLLRYFQNKSFREVGQSLGTNEEAARKRVSRAVESLRDFFATRGVAVGGSGLCVLLSTNAVQAAPMGLVGTISSAVAILQGSLQTQLAIASAKTLVMTTAQKTIIVAALTAAIGTGLYQTVRASRLNNEVEAIQQKQALLNDQLQQAQQERDAATTQLTALSTEHAQLSDPTGVAFKSAAAPNTDDSLQVAAKNWLGRVQQLKAFFAENPALSIPELQFAKEEDWLAAARQQLESERDYRAAAAALRSSAKSKVAQMLYKGLQRFAGPVASLQARYGARELVSSSNPASTGDGGRPFPADLAQLQQYMETPLAADILERWVVQPVTGDFSKIQHGPWVVTEKAPVDEDYDSRFILSLVRPPYSLPYDVPNDLSR